MTELRELAADVTGVRFLVGTLLRITQDPHGTGRPLGPVDAVYYAPFGEKRDVIVYTVGENDTVTIEAIRKVVAL